MQTGSVRERMFTMRMSKEESDRLDALAEHFGLNAVGVLRLLMKEKTRELGIEPAPPPAKPAPKPARRRK